MTLPPGVLVVTDVPRTPAASVRVQRGSRTRTAFRYARIPVVGPGPQQPGAPAAGTPAAAAPAPPGVISEVLASVNAARAAGRRCDGTTGPALPPVQYSAELGRLADKHAADFAAKRDNDFLADLRASGFPGIFVAERAVICPRIADAPEVFAAMTNWEWSCSRLFDPEVDRIGMGYRADTQTTNAWVLEFGKSSPG